MPPTLVDPHVRSELSGSVTAGDLPASLELDFRVSALRIGWWLGWAALAALAVGIAVGADPGHRWLVLALAAVAGTGNLVAMRVPWRGWLRQTPRAAPLHGWSGAPIGFIAP